MTDRKGRKPVSTMAHLQRQAPEDRISSEVRDHIGAGLRAIYNEVVEQPVPDRFLKLLEALKKAEEEKN